MGEFLKNLGSAATNAGMGLIGTGISRLFGLSWSPGKAMREQQKYNKEIMALQNQYNQEAAKKSQEYAKEYWDYTNTENQVQHLKNAGLNIGLMYGQSGTGGMGATGGGRQESVDQPQGNPVGMALQVQQIEQQERMNNAQITLAEAQAEKAKAEATKISGVDTQEALKRIEEGLTKAQVSEAFAVAGYYSEKAHTEYWAKENEKIQNQYLKDTYEERVKAAAYNNAVAIALAAKYVSEKDVNEKQIDNLQASIEELQALADKHNWDKETYRKQVEGMIERWEEQTFNERIGLGLEFGDNIVNMLYKGRKKQSSVKTKSTREGETTTTETYTESY